MVAGAVSLALAFFWYDQFTNAFGLAVSLVILAFGLYCLATAFRALFIRGSTDDEED